jgi:hypothetical protein
MRFSEQINDLAAALSKAQGAMEPAVKDAVNPAFVRDGKKSTYADLAANVEAARPHLAANGLSVVQEATTVERGVAVATCILHSSGQWIQFDPITVPLGKADAHGVGSATTYARRYALGAALGLVAEDDDGNAATDQAKGAKRETPLVKDLAPKSAAQPVITADQRTVLRDLRNEKGWSNDQIAALFLGFGFNNIAEITRGKYDEIKAALEAGPKATAA